MGTAPLRGMFHRPCRYECAVLDVTDEIRRAALEPRHTEMKRV